MANKEIRIALLTHGIKQYILADVLGITETTLSRKLRKELPPEEKERFLAAIERMIKEGH